MRTTGHIFGDDFWVNDIFQTFSALSDKLMSCKSGVTCGHWHNFYIFEDQRQSLQRVLRVIDHLLNLTKNSGKARANKQSNQDDIKQDDEKHKRVRLHGTPR